MLQKVLWASCVLALSVVGTPAFAATVRIAEHRQARIEALKAVIPDIEKQTGVDIELVEYPGPDREYVSKLLTEIAAGAGPDVFSLPSISQVVDFATAGYLQDVTEEVKASDAYSNFYDITKKAATFDDGKIYVMPTMLSVQQLFFSPRHSGKGGHLDGTAQGLERPAAAFD